MLSALLFYQSIINNINIKIMEFKDFKGKVFTEIIVNKEKDEILFKNKEEQIKMYHSQDCCENVSIEDINGDLSDLLNTEILVADEKTNEDDTDWGTCTYTFYTFRTIKGSVDIRWFGESNGYYSESVDIVKADKNGNFGRW